MNIHLEMHWPQWTLLTLIAFDFLLHCFKHGESQGEYHAGLYLLGTALSLFLLLKGGFFGS